MLKKCYCVLTNATYLPDFDGDVIGVDKGAWICFKHGIEMKAAIGDFDSITSSEKELLQSSGTNMTILNPRKDVSDSEAAVQWAKAQGYEQIVLVTSMSGRFDHTYVNFQLVHQYDCVLMDGYNKVFLIHEGTTQIERGNYQYISFFACEESLVTLEGFSYPLVQYRMTGHDVLGLSNEILNKKGLVTTTGKLWCIQSNDAN